jgi:hypothetical protein
MIGVRLSIVMNIVILSILYSEAGRQMVSKVGLESCHI